MFEKTLLMDLFIFDGDCAGEGAGDGGAAEAAGQVAADDNVAVAENATTEEGTEIDLDAEFDEIIKGKYKDQFERKFKTLSERRFRGQRQMKSELEAYRKTMDRVMPRYEAKTLDELNAKLDNDDNYIREKAAEKGMSEDAYREFLDMQERLAANDRIERNRARNEQLAEWARQGEEVKGVYPDFDLAAEIDGNEEFFDMINHGVPVMHAYRLTHYDELVQSAVRTALRKGAAQATESIKANKQRPSENGTGHRSPGKTGINIGALSRAECEEMERRAARGERVFLK